MSNDKETPIPARAPPRKKPRWPWAVLAVIAVVCLTVAYEQYIARTTPEVAETRDLVGDGVRLQAGGHHMLFIAPEFRMFDGRYALSGSLLLMGGPGDELLRLTPEIFHALCGQILARAMNQFDAAVERKELFRLALNFPIVENGALTGERYNEAPLALPISNGACPTPEMMEKITYNSYPGRLQDWGCLGMFEYYADRANAPDVVAVFASVDGKLMPPLPFEDGCRATLFDLPILVPDLADELDKIAVMFLASPIGEVQSPEGQRGVTQEFAVSGSDCSPTSPILQAK